MAKSFKEITRKAENLIEQGKEADREVKNCQSAVSSANTRVAAARLQLDEASETDEEGRPRGDVDSAKAELNMAEAQLAARERALSSARHRSDRIRSQKNSEVSEIERHNQIARANLEKLQKLKSLAFGENSATLAEGMAERLNEAEDARAKLLRSMGLDATPNHYSSSGEGTSAYVGGVRSFSAIDTRGTLQHYQGGSEGNLAGTGIAAPIGGGLGTVGSAVPSNVFSQLSSEGVVGNASDSQTVVGSAYSLAPNKEFMTREDLSDEIDRYACDYQSNSPQYNESIRNYTTNEDVETFRNIINEHSISEDTTFFRRASIKDLGDSFFNLPIEQWAGRCYLFEGIMSTSGTPSLANAVSHDDIVFEIKAPSGTPALDLTNVPYFQEAMFDSPFCVIESARLQGHNTTHVVVRILNSKEALNHISDHDMLNDYMRIKHGIRLDSSISTLNLNTVKSAIDGMESVIKEYPDVGKHLSRGMVSKSGIMSCSGDTLCFNPDYFSDETKLRETCQEQSQYGYWIRNSSPSSIGVHEAAHGIEWALIQNNSKYSSEEKRIRAWNDCTEANRIVKIACRQVRKTDYGKGKSRGELVQSISDYANTSPSETMAEAFADVYANGENANALSLEITRITRKLMDKYKGGK